MGDHGAVVAQVADGHAMRPVETVAVVHPFERGVGVGNEQQRPMVGESGVNETAVEQRYLRDGPIGRVRDEQPCDMFADGGLEVRDQDDEQPGGEVVGETVRTAGCAQRTWITQMVDEVAVGGIGVTPIGQGCGGVRGPAQRGREGVLRVDPDGTDRSVGGGPSAAGRRVANDRNAHVVGLEMKPDNHTHDQPPQTPVERRWARKWLTRIHDALAAW